MQPLITSQFKKTAPRVFKTTRPLPIIKVGGEVDMVYMLRLTPQGRYTKDQVISWLDTTFFEWILAEETAKKLHYHVVIVDDCKEVDTRNKVLKFLHGYWHKLERGRGWGNAQYNLQEADNIEDAVTYTVKDGLVVYSDGVNEEAVDQLRKKSYKKYDKGIFAKDLQKIYDDYKTSDEKGIRELMIRLCQLKGQYRQPINMHYIYQCAITANINKNPKVAEMYVDDYLDKLISRR